MNGDVTGSVVGGEQVSTGVVDGDVAGVGFEIDCTYRLKGPSRCIDIEACHFVGVTKPGVGAGFVGRYGEWGGSAGSCDVFLVSQCADVGIQIVDGDFVIVLEGYVYALHGFRLIGLVRVLEVG